MYGRSKDDCVLLTVEAKQRHKDENERYLLSLSTFHDFLTKVYVLHVLLHLYSTFTIQPDLSLPTKSSTVMILDTVIGHGQYRSGLYR